MNRRGFMGAILAASAAPVLVRYGSLMRPRALTPLIRLDFPRVWVNGEEEMHLLVSAQGKMYRVIGNGGEVLLGTFENLSIELQDGQTLLL